jgi:hypothetical protein
VTPIPVTPIETPSAMPELPLSVEHPQDGSGKSVPNTSRHRHAARSPSAASCALMACQARLAATLIASLTLLRSSLGWISPHSPAGSSIGESMAISAAWKNRWSAFARLVS